MPITRSMSFVQTHRIGISLLEVVFVLAFVVFLMSSVMFVYIVVLRANDFHIKRSELDSKLHFALERVVRDLRKSNNFIVENHSIRYTADISGVGYSHIFYLHNASDSWPPAYNQSTYTLMLTDLVVDIYDDFVYGAGEIVATNLTPPPSGTTITNSGNVIQIKLTGQNGAESESVSGYVRARNKA